MRSPEPHWPLIVLIGPTAVGKTEISIQLAERCNGEILSADSRLFYRGMDIGTAKPTLEERKRVPHYFIDIADPDQTWSLAMFQREVHRVISDIQKRNKVPFLVGGTGQYIRAVTEEWIIPATPPDTDIRRVLEEWTLQIGSEGLHDRLTALDPDAAKRIDARNIRRTIRAMEVILLTGKPFSTQKSRGKSRYRLLQLGLTRPRPDLYNRIDSRIDGMLEAGLVDEVRGLLAAGYTPELPSLSAIGYRQIIDYLQGEINLDEAVQLMQRITRQYVRRQANWFKLDDPNIQWFNVNSRVLDELQKTIRAFLTTNII